jgi:hypothetical protein
MAESLVDGALTGWQLARPSYPVVILGGIGLLFFLDKLMAPPLNRDEPPLSKPTIPWIGHIVGLIQHSAAYLVAVRLE